MICPVSIGEALCKVEFESELYDLKPIRRGSVWSFDDDIPDGRLHDVELDKMGCEEVFPNMCNQVVECSARDQAGTDGSRNVVRIPTRRARGEFAVPEAADELQCERLVDTPCRLRPGQRSP